MSGDDRPLVGIGLRVRAARKLAGITQRQLADRAHVSVSLVEQVEQVRVPASPAFVAAVARALQIPATELMSQPGPILDREDHRVHAVIPDLRRELASHVLPPDPGPPPRPVPELVAAVAHISALRHSVAFDALGARLPGLLGHRHGHGLRHLPALHPDFVIVPGMCRVPRNAAQHLRQIGASRGRGSRQPHQPAAMIRSIGCPWLSPRP